MSDTYTKLFSSITESTIWQEPAGTRLVWIAMLAKCNRHGEVFGSIPGMAHLANVTLAEAEKAIATFLAPDPYSRTPDNEGRRIEVIDRGWRILNHAKFDRLRSEIEAQERDRERKRQWDRDHRNDRPNSKNRHSAPDAPPTNPDVTPTQSDPPPAVAVTEEQELLKDPLPNGSGDVRPAELDLGDNVASHPDRRVVDVVLTAYHDTLPKCQRCTVVNPKLQRTILAAHKLARKICREQGWRYEADHFWRQFFAQCLTDPWLRGETPNPRNPRWRQNIGVLIAEERFAEIMNRAIDAMRDEAAA